MGSIDSAGKQMQVDIEGAEMKPFAKSDAVKITAEIDSTTDKDVAITEMNDNGETIA